MSEVSLKSSSQLSDNTQEEFEGESSLYIKSKGKEDTDVYPDAELNISRETASVFQLKRRWEKTPSMLDLTPDFQREYVWNIRKQSELIESLLMGIPLPAIYVRENEKGVYIVVDGKQRLTTLFRFINGEFKLENLTILPSYKGMRFSDLTPLEQNKIEDYTLQVNAIKPPTSDRVIFDLFDRVNRGGAPLNNQEMRNALYQGNATKLINDLAESRSFIDATENSIASKHMKDRYLVLRFLAFYILREKIIINKAKGEILIYKSNLEDFLGSTMKFLNKLDSLDPIFLNLKNTFLKTMEIAAEMVVPIGGFRLPAKPGGVKRPLNMAFFESFSYLLSKMTNPQKELVKFHYDNLLNNEKYLFSLTHSVDSNRQIEARYNCIDEELTKILNP